MSEKYRLGEAQQTAVGRSPTNLQVTELSENYTRGRSVHFCHTSASLVLHTIVVNMYYDVACCDVTCIIYYFLAILYLYELYDAAFVMESLFLRKYVLHRSAVSFVLECDSNFVFD